ncbi:MAG: undecaprenyl-phosphate glucose phosphotransferase, partial [Pseudomonadota bacterium]
MSPTHFSGSVFQSDVTRSQSDALRGKDRSRTGPLPDISALTNRPLVSRAVIRGFARVVECTLLAALGFAIAFLYVPEVTLTATSPYLFALLATSLVAVLIFDALTLYTVGALGSVVRQVPRLMLGWTVALAGLVAGVFFLKLGPEFSRVWLATWFASGAVAICAARGLFALQVQRWIRSGRLERRAVIYGGGATAVDLAQSLQEDTDTDVRVIGYFDQRADERSDTGDDDLTTLGDLEDLVALARKARIDIVILNLPITAEDRIATALSKLNELPVAIRMPASTSRIRFRPRTYSYYGKVPFIDLTDPP